MPYPILQTFNTIQKVKSRSICWNLFSLVQEDIQLKIKCSEINNPQLLFEYTITSTIDKIIGISKYHSYNQIDHLNFLMMEPFGKSLKAILYQICYCVNIPNAQICQILFLIISYSVWNCQKYMIKRCTYSLQAQQSINRNRKISISNKEEMNKNFQDMLYIISQDVHYLDLIQRINIRKEKYDR